MRENEICGLMPCCVEIEIKMFRVLVKNLIKRAGVYDRADVRGLSSVLSWRLGTIPFFSKLSAVGLEVWFSFSQTYSPEQFLAR